MLSIALSIICIIVVLTVHELGHALAARKFGVRVKRFGIGWPLPRVPFFEVESSVGGEVEFAIRIHPCFIGAYVELDRDKYLRLPFRQRVVIDGGGIAANLIMMDLLLALDLCFIHHPSWDVSKMAILALVFLPAICFILWPYHSCAYGIPIIGMVLLVAVAVVITQKPWEAVSGPIGIIRLGAEYTSRDKIFTGPAALSLILGIGNTLPMLPLDGGLIVREWFKRLNYSTMAARFEIVSIFTFGAFAVFAIASDIVNLFK